VKRWAVLIAVAMTATFAGAALAPIAAADTASTPSAVTVVHGIKGVPVDVYVNGTLTLPNFQPKDIAGPLQLPAGDYTVQIVAPPGAANTAANRVIDTKATVPSGKDVSLVAYANTSGKPALGAFVNDLAGAKAGETRVSVRHTANAPKVNVLLNDATAIADLENGKSADATLAAGTYKVAVTVASTGTVAIGPANLTFAPGVFNAVYAISALNGSGLEPLIQTRPLDLPAAVPTSSVYVVHGVIGVPVDVYVNGALTIPAFQPKDVAGPLQLPPGDYKIQLFPAATTPPATAPEHGAALTQTVTVPTGANNISLVANVSPDGALQISPFVNDVSALATGKARLSVRHMAKAPAVDVLINDKATFTNVTSPQAGNATVDAGTYTAAVALTGTTTPVTGLGPASLTLGAGTFNAVYAVSSLAAPTTYDLVVQTITLTRGYDLFAADGGVFAYGDTKFVGSAGALKLNKPVVGAARTPSGKGYWMAASDGGIFNYGDASFYGSTGAIKLNSPIVGMTATSTGKGYWLVAADGGIFAFGDATFYGSTGAIKLNKPIVGLAATATGKGYWMTASDGGIFAFGDAKFYGGLGAITLNKPVVGIATSPGGLGYWLVASDGGVFNFGNAAFFGSTGALKLNQPIVGLSASSTGAGYALVASDGGVFNYGNAGFYGSTGALKLNSPIVAIAN